jgi:gliding motility-associated-like protein
LHCLKRHPTGRRKPDSETVLIIISPCASMFRILLLVSISLLISVSNILTGQTLIINEVSNGPGGNQEYVEFIVVDDAVTYDCASPVPPCIDIRGWIFDDNSGYHGSAGVAPGCVRFAYDPLWACVPVGTIIVIYNNADPNASLPANDVSMDDGNCTIVAPINSPLFDSNSTTPGAVACSYPTTGWTSGGNWNNTVLANTGDCARIVDLSGCEVFSLCWGTADQNSLIYFAGNGADDVWSFTGTDPYNQADWSQACAGDIAACGSNDQTPGAPNNAANAAYIGQFNNNCSPITPMVSSVVLNSDATCGCDGQATASGSGSIAGYTYEWFDQNMLPIGQTGATATGLCPGTYYSIVTSSIGCADTSSVTIISNGSVTVTVNSVTICNGSSATLTATPSISGGTYLWTPGGSTSPFITVSPSSTTVYTVEYAQGGCLASASGTITVNPVYNLTQNATVCQGDSYTFPDGTSQVISATLSYTANLTTLSGCDSVIVTNVAVNPVYNLTQNATVCQGDSYTFPDGTSQVISATLSYTSNLTTLSGCDSVIVTNVAVNPVYNLTQNATVCQGDSYTFTDGTSQVISATLSYTSSLTTLNGCDSIIVTNVAVNPVYNLTQNATVCQGDSYTFPDGTSQVISANLSYTSNLTTLNGCDSIIVTNVAVNPVYNLTQNATVCQGDSYTFPDGTSQLISADLSYTSNLTTLSGCDSVIVTNVAVNPVYNLTENVTLCEGSNYTYPDGTVSNNITTDESQISNLLTAAGCDSVITTFITINSIITTSANTSLCSGSSFTFADGTTQNNITANLSYTSSFVSVQGCDSLHTENISVNPVYNLTENATVCQGDSYTFPDGTSQLISVDLSYTSNLTTLSGCDSVIVTNVAVNPVYNLTQNATVCQGDSYTFPDGTSQLISADLSYTSNLTTLSGCDSVIVTNVAVNPLYNLTENVTLCQGSNYTYPDGTVSNNITTDESHISNLLTAAGCDSVLTTFITINSIITTSANTSLCSGSSFTFADGTTQNNITANLSYTSSFVSVQGCDSLHTENISVNPVYNLTENATVCQGDSYTFPDGTSQVISADLSYTSNLTTLSGCDSVIVTNVAVNPVYNLTQNATVCQGDSYTFPDGTSQLISADLSYTSNLTTLSGCDSVIVTNVAVNPVYNQTQNVTLCQGSNYTYPDGTVSSNITTDESHISNLLTAAGCDSVITTFITINSIITTSANTSLCSGSSFTFADGTTQNNITANLSYTSSFVSVQGCDSLHTENISVNPVYALTQNATVCQGDSYTFPDGTSQLISANLSYTSNLTTLSGCDSVIVTNVAVNPVYNLTQNATVCQGDSYTFPDGTSQVISATLSYTSNLTTLSGCDSVIVTNVAVNPVYNLTENVTLCEGSNYTYPDGTVSNNITTDESHISNLLTAAGCDSVLTTFITINSIITTSANTSLCSGSSFTFADGTTQNNITANLSYTSSFVSVQGCDSLHTENISVNPVYNLTENATVCQGDSYTFPDGTSQVISATLSYTSSLTTLSGCDSVIVTNVAVNPVYNLTQNATVCQGDSYTFPDGTSQVISADLSYTSNLTTLSGCDSVIVTNVAVNPVYNLTENVTLCQGSNYTYPDGTVSNNITTDESHISNLLTAAGCDSVLTTFITINSIITTSANTSLCSGSSFTFADGTTQNNITANLSYTSSFVSVQGCDSLHTENISVNPVYNLTENATVCQGDSYTFPDGTSQLISVDLSYTSNLTTLSGCDSVIVTNVAVNPVYNLTQNATVCQGDSYTFPDGTSQLISADLSYTSNLTTLSGCDSVIVTNVAVNPVYNLTENVTLCEGSNYTYPDGTVSNNITTDESRISNLLTAAGCDSVITTFITINSFITTSANTSLCSGSSFTFADGTTQNNITANLSYTSSFVSVQGCDSLHTENISVNPVYALTQNATVCQGDSYTFPDGTSQLVSANLSYTSNLTTLNGCDSVIVTNVAVNPVYNLTQNATVCQGDNYTFPDGTSQVISATLSYTSNLTTLSGCDSVIVTNVAVNPVYNLTENVTLCQGSNYTYPDGTVSNNITTDESHISNLLTAAGCDSVLTTFIQIIVPTIDAGENQVICEGQPITLSATGSINYTWSNSVQNGVPFVPSTSTTYSVTGTDDNGCIAQDQVLVTVRTNPQINPLIDQIGNCAPVTVTFSNPSENDVMHVWYLSNGVTLTGNPVSYTFEQGGTYGVSVTAVGPTGCSSTYQADNMISVGSESIAEFTANPNEITTLNPTVQLFNSSFNANEYLWIFPDGSSTNEINPNYTFQEDQTGNYQIMLITSNEYGCIDTAIQVVSIQEELIFYVPNTFTPDGDIYNQTFKPIFTSGFDPYDYTLLIFNRWGEIVFESHNSEIGWDGSYSGVNGSDVYQCQDGTYTWKIIFKVSWSDERKVAVGHVNLLR